MPSQSSGAAVTHLRRGGTSILLRLSENDLPCILHWGPDLGELSPTEFPELLRSLEMPGPHPPTDPHSWASLVPQQTAGWLGRPGLQGSRGGRAWALTFTSVSHHLSETEAGGARLRSVATDERALVELTTELELHPSGLVRLRAGVRNVGEEPYEVGDLSPALPVPSDADELLDMAGRPGTERTPQRRPFDRGQWVREAWGGRPGHDSATVLCAGRPGFGHRRGRVWGVHLAWSGNQSVSAEHTFTGWKLLRGGELLGQHEVVLAQNDEYISPWLYGSWGDGLDALAGRFHDYLRARSTHPTRTRPVVVNTWEAFYFKQSPSELVRLAELAAEVGAERFVLDDGWFKGRRDDTSSLGDWTVDTEVFPQGLLPLASAVRDLGMEFGLWFEPEMVNLNSDLARAHPDWIMGTEAGPGHAARHQHVLDLANPEVWQHVFGRVSALVQELDVAYIKWDHNRPLTAAGHGRERTPGVHGQTLATYRMMDELTRRHPGLEIESCCGGGGRLDLGIMEYASRAWLSDCIDAHERQRMVRWTALHLPLEMMGTHVGAPVDHTTGRRHSLEFRAGTAMWGHLGIEWDLTKTTESERGELKGWIDFYKQHRGLLHTGRAVHDDAPAGGLKTDGVVSLDAQEGLFRVSALQMTDRVPAGRIRLSGLNPEASYEVRVVSPATTAFRIAPPQWFGSGVDRSGRTLEELGLIAPLLKPDQLVFLHVRARA